MWWTGNLGPFTFIPNAAKKAEQALELFNQ